MSEPLRIGYVPGIFSSPSFPPRTPNPQARNHLLTSPTPEHFSTPLHFAATHFSLSATLIPFPSGTGHMITSLRADEIDVGIGLTEGWIAGLAQSSSQKASGEERKGGYKLVGTYVETPLCWAISTGSGREDIKSVEDLKGGRCGVSRIGR